MDFINKLIKKGIFGLVLCFSFFAMFAGEKVSAASECKISVLNDGEYLVLNEGVGWSDSGANVVCGSGADAVTHKNIAVSINGSDPVTNSTSGQYVSDSYVTNAGFYAIKYSWISDETVSVTRYVRVLPFDLNGVKNVWINDFEANTANDDTFVKIVDHKNNYIAIGNFGTSSYVAYFESTGKYLWHTTFENTELKDVAKSGDASGNIYYIAGKNNNGNGFVKAIQLNNDVGINSGYAVESELTDMSVVNKIVVALSDVYAVGYKANANGSRTGKIAKLTHDVTIFKDIVYAGNYSNTLSYEYNSAVISQSLYDGSYYVVSVGNTEVSGQSGATGGLVTSCNLDLLTCTSEDAYLWKNNNSNTTTVFNDIVEVGTTNYYMVVGSSRIDSLYASTNTTGGGEAALVVLLKKSVDDGEFSIVNGGLKGSYGFDSLYSIRSIASSKFVAVGEQSGNGLYLTISVNIVDDTSTLSVSDDGLVGLNGDLKIKDVFVKKGTTNADELSLVFVGGTTSGTIEGIDIVSKGLSDAFITVVDSTKFSNYENKNVLQGSVICEGGLTSCKASLLSDEYKMSYGSLKVNVSAYDNSGNEATISSVNVTTYSVFHTFTNENGVKFIIGKKIVITATPVAPDITVSEQGINKWYLYSRYQKIGNNTGLDERKTLWTDRYMPVDNNEDKVPGTTYYIIEYNSTESRWEFAEDTSGKGYTYNNYIKLQAEPLQSNVAFQSEEKLEEYALLQEFARVAFVQGRYSFNTTNITPFQNEAANLTRQNYYFVYYIDLEFSNSLTCGTLNGELSGRCNAYTGYAFSNLSKIKEIASLIIEKYNGFKNESSNAYVAKDGVNLPSTAYFKEELTTIRYMKTAEINLTTGLYLETSYYAIDATDPKNFVATPEVTAKTGQSSVVFSSTGDYTGEGKYVVRYCYNYVNGGENTDNCGDSATFVIDRTKPVVKYKMLDDTYGSIDTSWSSDRPYPIGYNMTVQSMVDIDPYAYAVVNNQKYYLECNAVIGSKKCLEDLETYVLASYSYDKKNPDKLFNIKVYDRAGNDIDAYFKIGTNKPGMSIVPSVNSDSFALTIDFHEKNSIQSFGVYFTSSEICDADTPCASDTVIQSAIIDYINALIYNNNALIESAKTNPAINLDAQLVKSITLHFNSSDLPNGGVSIPISTLTEIDGMSMYTFTDPETPYLVTDGLYEFTLYDEFNNVINGFAGIGIENAELDININADYTAQEVVWDEENHKYEYNYETRIPLTKDERGDNPNDALTFLVSDLSKYKFTVPDYIDNGFNKNMYFTNRFVYVRFKMTEFGILRISKAKELNIVGGYGESDETNTKLNCLFKIYGAQAASKVGACTGGTLIPIEGLTDVNQLGAYKDALEAKGIYIIGEFNDYYHLVITEEGTYDVWNEVSVSVEIDGVVKKVPTNPAYYSFTIDRTAPTVNVEASCDEGETCKGELSKDALNSTGFEFVDNDAYKLNIGNHYMNVKIDLDVLIGNYSNRLLAIKVDGPEKIARELDLAVESESLACNPYRNPCNAYEFAQWKDFIEFRESGTYKITIYDGVYQEVYARNPVTQEEELVHVYNNGVSYTFIIDGKDTPPEIIEIVDANGKNFSSYQQYIDVKLKISESSFLYKREGETMLTLTYHIEGMSQQTITVVNNGGSCELSTGSFDDGECTIVGDGTVKSLILDVVIPINKTDKQSGDKYLVLKATDYFGNERSERQVFYFDNNSPYVYFSNEYTPILKFGSEATTAELNQMLSTDANPNLGAFICNGDNGIRFTVGIDEVEKVIMYCGDTPQITGVDNATSVQAYEAQRVAFNNYIKGGNNTYTLLENGTSLQVTDVVYKKPYTTFISKADLQAHISQSLPVYVSGQYIPVSSLEKVDPNETYYLSGDGGTSVTINDLYTNASAYEACSTSTDSKCVLYNMYMNEGNFSKLSDSVVNPDGYNFYVYDNKGYRTAGAVVVENWMNYYKESDGSYVQDEGKYLPALTLVNSCVKVSGGNCTPVEAGKIKVKHENVEYRNIIEKMDTTGTNYPSTDGIIVSTTMSTGGTKYTVLDNRIWQISYYNGENVKFGFGLASNLGRPIIFVANDGAGNISSNYLETVIAIKDNINPEVNKVYTMYELDNSAAATENNYIKEIKYYRLSSVPDADVCAASTSKYFKNESGTYVELGCTELEEGKQYYVSSVVYTPVADGMAKQEGKEYYKRKANDDLGTNYLTSENMVVEFSEPIYRISCSYYLYDNSGSVAAEYNYNCGFNDTEFDYGDDKRSFYLEFNYDLGAENPNYFVHYNITVWDFSNNSQTFAAFYIDREKPTIVFNSNVSNEDNIEAVYTSGSSDESKYNNVYLTNDFLKETLSKDSINNVISGDASEINKFSYDVKYYEFNYDITYKNYIKNGNIYESVANGKSKLTDYSGKTMYVLIKKPTDYVLKGIGECGVIKEDGEYCYVEDDYNYYPSLVEDTLYWKELAVGEYIKNNTVKVYKIEYIVTDYSGNVSDTLIKTVYCVDRVTPTLVINDQATTDRYGYHMEVNLKFDNEKEAYLYVYKCKDAVTTCELPAQIFADKGSYLDLREHLITSLFEATYNEESIYKIYLHDRGDYVTSVNSDGIQVETLKYNFIEYTFLIDRTSPDLYLDANKDDSGNLYYYAHLNKEEMLYCVIGNRFADDLSFTDKIECKNNPLFAGEWKNDSDYVNMSVVYEYNDGTDTYKVSVANGTYILYKNTTPYLLGYVDDNTYEYKDEGNSISYVLTNVGEDYKLNINGTGEVDLVLTYVYKDAISNIDYKFVINGEDYKLYINGVENVLTLNNGVYEYKDNVNYVSYSIRLRNGTYQIKVTNESVITRQLYNSRGLLIYEERYEKLAPNAQKYFYNTYYKYVNGEFEVYALGASYVEDNVYIITSINVFFREDGQYLLMAQDKSGNDAGRRLAGIDYDADYSSFVVDNSAPNYNKDNNAPTGVNYWYSVPNVIIDTEEEVNNILSLTKDPSSNSYNIDGSGLNNSYFYAFATKSEAENYLNSLYSAHINSLEDNTCTKNGKKGFAYTYYNPLTGEIISSSEAEGCFVGTGGKSNKTTASDRMKVLAKQLVFATFAQNKMFNDSSINQKVCSSSECNGQTSMYKSVYLQIDYSNSTRTIVETCNEVKSGDEYIIECIKVNAKMIKNDTQNGNSVSFEINGDNTKDTSKIVVYSKSTNNNASTSKSEYTSSSTIALNNNTYYIFEEFDTTITYTNYPVGDTAYEVSHTNVSYYAIYIDNNDYIDVYYKVGLEPGSGDSANLTGSGQGIVRTNVDNYSLIIKNNGDSNFENNYEIYALRDELGNILEIYSYLIVEVNERYYYNLNDYIVRNGNDYYFEIPMEVEKLTKVVFIDRTGTKTRVDVSISRVAPYLEVVYNGDGGDQTVNLSITDSTLTKTVSDSVEILFSPNGQDYSSAKTQDILKALMCKSGTSGLVYDCINTGAANGINNYRVIIRNLQDLYGFFKVNLTDNHGNSNTIEFIYNPADMSADYPNITKFVTSDEITHFANQEMRMLTNDQVQLEFNNEVNYVILYKFVDGEPVEVCNTKAISDGPCKEGNTLNKVSRVTDDGGNYINSVLYYTDEGLYTAKIVNRASEVIYSSCFTIDGQGAFVVSEDCKEIKTYRGLCSWDNNADYCDDPMEVIIRDVNKANGQSTYNKLEVDKTLPTVDLSKFTITSPSGEETFINNGVYKNAEVTIKWAEELVQLRYTCEYIDSALPCNGNSTGFYVNQYSFVAKSGNDGNSTKYTFWLEDFAGNSTINDKYSFTIEVVPPTFEVYEVDEDGAIIQDSQVERNSTITSNTKLLCRLEGNVSDCNVYKIKLYEQSKTAQSSWTLIGEDMAATNITVEYGEDKTFRYMVYVKNTVTGAVYENIWTEFIFTIDKKPPTIVIGSAPDLATGLYKGNVQVSLADTGLAIIYAGCVDNNQVDEFGDRIYDCSNVVEYATFTASYTLEETNIYKIVALDEWGNITQESDIKYISIDNEAPTIDVFAKGEYLDYTIPENGFTNKEVISVQVKDNNVGGYLKYRMKNPLNDTYDNEWLTTKGEGEMPSLDYFEFMADGFYEIIPVDAIGNEGSARHFIIYRGEAVYKALPVNEKDLPKDEEGKPVDSLSGVVSFDFYITWENNSLVSYIAPIVKVTLNGKPYAAKQTVNTTGEHVFEFTDLAGNVTTFMMVLDKSDVVCLNNLKIKPRARFTYPIENNASFEIGDYKFKSDDVIIFAVRTNYYTGNSCGNDMLCYRQINDDSYFVVGSTAGYFNGQGKVQLNTGDSFFSGIDSQFGYAIVVSKDVAKKDLGLPIGENFFTKDPLGWSLIFIAGAASLYVAIRLIFFRKKVKVLK